MAISLSSIRKSTALKAPKIVIYGTEGVGKTSWACAAPKPILIQAEEGLGTIAVDHFPLARSYQEILDALTSLIQEDHDYQTVVLDSLDTIEALIWKHVVATAGPKQKRQPVESIADFGWGNGYDYARDEFEIITQGLDVLRNEKGMCVILIAHSEVKRVDSPESEPYDRYQMRLQKKSEELIRTWCDALLFANFRVHIVKDKTSFNPDGRARAAGRGDRVLYTDQRPAWHAKNRYQLPPELPLDWNAFASAMAASGSTTDRDTSDTTNPNDNSSEN